MILIKEFKEMGAVPKHLLKNSLLETNLNHKDFMSKWYLYPKITTSQKILNDHYYFK